MEVSALNVSASAVQQIRINQDPYSAEYSRPGRGRIEILTKPGTQEYHGDGNADLPRRAPERAQRVRDDASRPNSGGSSKGSSAARSARAARRRSCCRPTTRRHDQQAFIYALGPSGIIQDTLPQSSGEALVTGSITHQISDRNTFSIRPNYQYESDENRGAGGTTLASAATTFKHHEQQVTYTQQTILRPTLVNQFQMLFGHEREPTTSLTPDRGIVVAGAFTGGGGQGDLVRTETHINLNESLAWTHGRHQVQAGFQLPDWSRRGFYDRTNFGGTFFFASLDAYSGRQAVRLHPAAGQRRPRVPRETGGRLHQGRLAGAAGLVDRLRPPLRLAELLSRQQQLRAARLGRVRARQQEDECLPRRESASSTIAAVRW